MTDSTNEDARSNKHHELALIDPAIPLLPALPLIGRDEQLITLRKRLQSGGNGALSALNGLPGVGKTALAIALAHDPELRTHFKDGILWAGLGPEPNLQSHLSRWGTLLGLSSSEMSTLSDSDAWALALHHAIGSRTMLLVIDDAWTPEDALTLKVGGPNCAHLVSTRLPAIATQIADEGAIMLKELNSDEGMVLLRMLAPRVVESETQRARELVMAVGGLPLALNLIGNYLRMQSYTGPARRIIAALQKLSEAGERLNINEPRGPVERHPSLADDTPVSLHAVIAVTDEQLNETTRQALHALAVFPPKPNSFSEEAALAIAACSIGTLDEINNCGLLEINSADRYSLHQTVADYARLQLSDDSVYQRLIAYFTSFVETHNTDYQVLELENSNILFTLETAWKLAQQESFIRLTCAFAPFLLARSLYDTAAIHLQQAYNAAVTLADYSRLASVLFYLGEMARKRSHYEQAEKYLQEGLVYARRMDNPARICEILVGLGAIKWRSGDYQQAEDYLQEGLKLARELGDAERMSRALDTLGSVELRKSNYALAEDYLQQGLQLARQINNHVIISGILLNLGVLAGDRGNITQSEVYLKEGLLLARQLGHSEWINLLLSNLGDVAYRLGKYTQAELYFQEGLELARRIGQEEAISVLLINLGMTACKQTHYDMAEQYLKEGLTVARQVGVPQIISFALYEYGNLYLAQQQLTQAESTFREILITVPEGSQDILALAHYGVARTLAAQGKIEEARQEGKVSIQIFASIGHYTFQEAREWFASLASDSSNGEQSRE